MGDTVSPGGGNLWISVGARRACQAPSPAWHRSSVPGRVWPRRGL